MKRIVLVVALCLTLAISFCSCGSNPTPTETADTFLTAVKANDTETIKTVYDGDDFNVLAAVNEEFDLEDSDDDSDDAIDGYFEKTLLPKLMDFDYELSNEKIDGDKATVDVKITTYDIGGAFTAFMTEYFSQALDMSFNGASDKEIEELANTIFESKMSELKEKTYSETVKLDLVNKDDVWKVADIDEEGDFMNAFCGNLIKTLTQLEETYSFDE